MNNILIRHANEKDIDDLVELEKKCFTTDHLSKNNLRHLLAANSAEIWVANHDKKNIGSLVILFRKNSKKARMYSLAVHPEFRSRGIAALLCQQMEKMAAKRRCCILLLEVNPDNHAAVKFYRKLGYVRFAEHKHYYEDGTPALRMKKDITTK